MRSTATSATRLGWRWNPEFTMLEAYQAYTDYFGIMETTQASIEQAVKDVTGGTTTKWGEHEIDWSHGNWRRMTMREAIVHFWRRRRARSLSGDDFAARGSVEALVAMARSQELVEVRLGEPLARPSQIFCEAVAEEHLMQRRSSTSSQPQSRRCRSRSRTNPTGPSASKCLPDRWKSPTASANSTIPKISGSDSRGN